MVEVADVVFVVFVALVACRPCVAALAVGAVAACAYAVLAAAALLAASTVAATKRGALTTMAGMLATNRRVVVIVMVSSMIGAMDAAGDAAFAGCDITTMPVIALTARAITMTAASWSLILVLSSVFMWAPSRAANIVLTGCVGGEIKIAVLLLGRRLRWRLCFMRCVDFIGTHPKAQTDCDEMHKTWSEMTNRLRLWLAARA